MAQIGERCNMTIWRVVYEPRWIDSREPPKYGIRKSKLHAKDIECIGITVFFTREAALAAKGE